MNILMQEIKDYYNALEKLGIKLNEDDILNVDVDKDDVRASFKIYDGEKVITQTKKLNDIEPMDIINIYNLLLPFAENEDEAKELEASVYTIAEIIKYKEEKIRLNNILVQEFKKANNSGKFDFVILEDEENNKEEKVNKQEDIKEDSETVKKAKKFIKDNSLIIISSLALVGALAYALTRNGDITTIDKDGNITTISYGDKIEDTQQESPVEEIQDETPVEEVVETNENATEVYENEEEVVAQIDPHSEESINATIDKVYSEIQASNNEDFKIEYDRDTVEALVRYAHHNYSEYTGENYISNTDAYDRFTNLYKNNINIASLFENLDNYERLNNLITKCKNVKDEKGVYSDEYEAYASIKECMDNLNSENYPEVIAIRVAVDNTMSISSMQLSRSGALEMVDTEELWTDVDSDGKVTYEENAEGEDNEKEKKVASINKDELLAIFNSVDINNENAPLTQATYKAIDEDEALGLTK